MDVSAHNNGEADAEPDAGEGATRQVEAMDAVDRPRDSRPALERGEGVLVGHEQLVGLDVVAAGAPHAADVPGIEDARAGFRIEVGDPYFLVAVGQAAGRVTVEDLARPVKRRGVHAAAREEPVAGPESDGPWYAATIAWALALMQL